MTTLHTIRLPDVPIVIETFDGSIDDILASLNNRTLLDEASEPVFLILDFSHAHLQFEEIFLGAIKATRGNKPKLNHPMIRQTLLVTSDPTLTSMTESMSSEIFGNIRIQVFKTLGDALAYTRSVLAVA